VSALLRLDGAQGEGGGQILRSALTLSAVTGQGFEMTRIRARRTRPGLRPQHLVAVRAAAMGWGAEVHGAFDGSPDLRFQPGAVEPGEFDFEIATAGAATLVLQTVLPALAIGGEASRVSVSGGTHVPRSPSHAFVARHWAPVVERLGLRVGVELERAGFSPRGQGRLRATVAPWRRPATPLDLTRRGRLLGVRGYSAAGRLRGDVAQRQADAARHRLWEERRIESQWEVVEMAAASPGSCLQVEAVFECGRAAFSLLGERGVRAEVLGERAARRLLGFLEDEAAAVDPWLADQMAVPLAVARGGGRLTTSEVTRHLETVVGVVRRFGIGAETWGRRGGPGGLEVASW
jgi:RNA 3'-terminal phosphate cyclase (ATP)